MDRDVSDPRRRPAYLQSNHNGCRIVSTAIAASSPGRRRAGRTHRRQVREEDLLLVPGHQEGARPCRRRCVLNILYSLSSDAPSHHASTSPRRLFNRTRASCATSVS